LTERQQWLWTTRVALAKALLTNDTVHADDIDVDLPRQHQNILGATFARFVQKGWMTEVVRRKGRKRASHGRKSGIFQVTPSGRRVFAGVGGSAGRQSPRSSPDPGRPPSARKGHRPVAVPTAGKPDRRRSSPAAVGPLPASSRLPKTHDPAVRAAREDALMDRVDHFVATTTGASAWWEQQELAAA
jgi:hypothetical protein